MFKLFVILSILLIASKNSSQGFSPCGDWKNFKDEKCFKYFDRMVNFSDAANFCIEQDEESTLALIKSEEEQDTIVNILEDPDVVNSALIGISKIDGKFMNFDGTDLDYSNWLKNRPLVNKTGFDCVEISTFETKQFGKWIDQRCQKHNAVICQKLQPWSANKLQNILIDIKRDLEKLKQNPVPIGFIYAQVFGQNEPNAIWPNTEWENISPNLAGLFFRVEGGNAAQFGQIQGQQTRSITAKSNAHNPNQDQWDTDITIGTEYSQFFTGSSVGHSIYHLIKHNADEIRPRNTAVRIWKRIQ